MTRGLFVIALALVVSSCSGSSADSARPPAPSSADNSYFTVPAERLSHVQIVPVAKTSWATTLQATGTVDWDNDHTTQAITQVGGVISKIAVDTGSSVKLNDPLLYVSSPDIANAVSTYRKAKNRLDLAQRTLDRSRDLLEHKAIADKDLEEATADYNDASTDVQNALEALRIFGVTQADLDDAEKQVATIRPDLAMRAPISGTVVQKAVSPGQLIQAGSTLCFVISDTSTVWVQGHLYEQDLGRIRVGDQVDIRNSAFPTTFKGTVSYIDRLVDPTTRTTLVRIVTPNTGNLLKKDLFVDLTIHDKAQRDVLVVPVASVLYNEQNFPFVYVDAGQGKFAQRLVKTGSQQGDQIEILDGLEDGERLVAEGSLFLQFANTVGQQ